MRTVYVDVLIVVNIFIDFMLLYAAAKALQLRVKLLRLVLGGLLGGVFSLAALLPPLPWALNLLTDSICAAALVLTAYGKTDIKSFLRRTAVFFGISFFFCGIMLFICTMFRPKGIEVYNDVVYFNISPVLLILFTLVCYYLLRLYRFLTNKTNGKTVCTVKLTVGGSQAEFRAIVDTGCDVREPFSGAYVIIAERELVPLPTDLFFHKRIIPFSSLGGEGILEGFRTDRLQIDGKELSNRIYIGLCDGVLKGEVKALVPSAIMKEL